jgi:hypothetical protein
MYFGTKSYLKSTHNHTTKHALNKKGFPCYLTTCRFIFVFNGTASFLKKIYTCVFLFYGTFEPFLLTYMMIFRLQKNKLYF